MIKGIGITLVKMVKRFTVFKRWTATCLLYTSWALLVALVIVCVDCSFVGWLAREVFDLSDAPSELEGFDVGVF